MKFSHMITWIHQLVIYLANKMLKVLLFLPPHVCTIYWQLWNGYMFLLMWTEEMRFSMLDIHFWWNCSSCCSRCSSSNHLNQEGSAKYFLFKNNKSCSNWTGNKNVIVIVEGKRNRVTFMSGCLWNTCEDPFKLTVLECGSVAMWTVGTY